jgi:cobalt-zinc-cadmium efflux system protein
MAGHDHRHHHDHGRHDFGPAFAIGIGLNLAYVAAEAGFGLWSGSMALLADAGHNLSDVLGLALAWGGLALAQRPASPRFTYGLKRSGILAALANAVLLFIACGAIAVEAVQRLITPEPVPGLTVMAVAAVGILVNGITAWLFARGRKGDVNIRGAYLHMLADAGVSAAVVVSGLIIWKTGLERIDPVMSLIVVAVILKGTWGLLTESVALALDAVPASIDAAAVGAFLKSRPGVTQVHDLHIWPMGTNEVALTAHLVMPGGHPGDEALTALSHDLDHQFGISHATFQVELGAVDCGRAACA